MARGNEAARATTPSSARFTVDTREGLMQCYAATFDEVYARAARLTHGDRATAEDLTHETFIKLVRAGRRGDVSTIGVGWLMTTLRHLFIDRYRSQVREERRRNSPHPASPSSPFTEPDSLSSGVDVLSGLPGDQAVVLSLRYIEDLSVREVADLMGRSVRSVESLLQRAKRNARQNLNQSGITIDDSYGDAS